MRDITSLTNRINDYFNDLNQFILDNQTGGRRSRLWEQIDEREVEDLINYSGLKNLSNNDFFKLLKHSVDRIRLEGRPNENLVRDLIYLGDDLSEDETDTESVGQAKTGGIILRRNYII